MAAVFSWAVGLGATVALVFFTAAILRLLLQDDPPGPRAVPPSPDRQAALERARAEYEALARIPPPREEPWVTDVRAGYRRERRRRGKLS